MTSRTYMVTGGAGFIGSNFVRYVLEAEPGARVINFDAMTYAGIQATVDELDQLDGHVFIRGDIRDAAAVRDAMEDVDVVVNFAAESHVDRSINEPQAFLETNVIGTAVLLRAAYELDVGTYVQVSTDEVYGSLESGFALEDDRLEPSSPYSASKAAADLLVKSYATTFGYPALITRCTNNYGPYQFPEKVIPLFVTNLIDRKNVPLYGDGQNERDWLYVTDHCSAIHLLVDSGSPGEVYNIGADEQLPNIDLTNEILSVMDLDQSFIDYVPDRLGHDFRYAVDSSKLRALGWKPKESFRDRLHETIEWYRQREDWWRPLRSG